jgi:hypothetical protein
VSAHAPRAEAPYNARPPWVKRTCEETRVLDEGAPLATEWTRSGGASECGETMNMPRYRQRIGALASLAVACGVLGSGCLEGPPFFVRACLVERADTCSVTSEDLDDVRTKGTFDASFGGDYACPLLLGNTDHPAIQITGADVEILGSDGQPLADAPVLSLPANGFVDSGSVPVPGLGVARVVLLDNASAEAQLSRSGGAKTAVIASVVVHGATLDGREVSSPAFRFPIDILPHQGLCDLSPCFPGSSGHFSAYTCRPGLDGLTSCEAGCPCTVGKGECAPLGCLPTAPGATTGTCGACRVGASDCTAPAECAPAGVGATGYCE